MVSEREATQVKVHTLDNSTMFNTDKSGTKKSDKQRKHLYYREGSLYINHQGSSGDKSNNIKRTIESNNSAQFLYLNSMSKVMQLRGQTIFKDFESLISLKKIVMADNKLTHVPSSVWTLPRLKFLVLPHNLISTIPPEAATSNLLELDLTRNNLTMPSVEVVSKILTLKELRMGMNRLSGPLPESFTNLKHLQLCVMNMNRITSLPLSMDSLPSLYFLNVSHNVIKMLPFTLDKPLLNNLTFNFQGNKLSPEVEKLLQDPTKLRAYLQTPEYRAKYLTRKEENNWVTNGNDYDYHAVFEDEDDMEDED